MKTSASQKQRLLAAAAAVMIHSAICAAPISKADNSDNLNLTTSWVGGVVPGPGDVATWDATVTGANTTVLGADLSLGGLTVASPGGPITIGAGNTLTLGTAGVDMSAATQNLTISSGLVIGAGGQTWNIATGRVLTTGAFTRSGAGSTLRLDQTVNTGAVTASPTLTNGIVGPWASIASAGTAANNATGGYTYATVSAGNLQPYTGATSQTLTTAWGGIPSGGTGTINYDISSSAAVLGATGLNRNINTIRYTGTGARQPGNNAGTLLTINGIMNSGTGTFTLGRNGANITNDFSFAINASTTGEIVLSPMTADIALFSFITGGANVTVAGNTNVVLGGANTYTGATRVTGGTLQVAGAGAINATSGITVNGAGAKYLHTSSTASSAAISLVRGTVDGIGTLGAVTVADNAANILANGNGGAGALSVSNLTFDGDATVNLTTTGSTPLTVAGALTVTPASGTVTLNINKTGWIIGTNNIIDFGSFFGDGTEFTLGTLSGLSGRQTPTGLSVNGNSLAVDVTGDVPVWTGLASSTWTTATTGDHTGPNNWATKTGQTGTNFWVADAPEFNDTYNLGAGNVTVANRVVDIDTADVAPGIVTFDNSLGNYSLVSSFGFGISGGASLVKFGTSDLIITNTNTYTGPTTINEGIVRLGDGTTDGSISSTSSITNHGSLVFNLTGTQTYTAPISGTGSLVKEGTGTVVLSGANTYQGGTTISAGTVTINGAGTLGTGNFSVATGATLNIDKALPNAATVTGGGAIVNTNTHTVSGDFTGFTGTYTHNSTFASTGFTSGTATSENAAYVLASEQGPSQGLIASGNGDYTLKMGSLSGVPNSLFRGGNVATGLTTLEIGALNTDTTFAGAINNGVTKSLALTKVGTGKLTLTGGVNTYSGDTLVLAGTLGLAGTSIRDTNKLVIDGGMVELTGTEVVDTLWFGATQQSPGTYGATGSGATFIDNTRFSGTGVLSVTNGPVAGYASWAAVNGTAGLADADHDTDGVSNGIEYFLGGPNGNTTGFTALPGVVTAGPTRTVTWTRAGDYPGVYGTDFLIESSETLATGSWTPETIGGNVTVSGNNYIYTFPAGDKRFVRLKIIED